MIQRELFGDFNLGIWPKPQKPQLKNLNAQVSLPTNTNLLVVRLSLGYTGFVSGQKIASTASH